MFITEFVVCLAVAATVTVEAKRRLVLHDDEDVIKALADLRLEFHGYKANASQQISQLEHRIADTELYKANASQLIAQLERRLADTELYRTNASQQISQLELFKANASQQVAQLEDRLADSTQLVSLLQTNFTEERKKFNTEITELASKLSGIQSNTSNALRTTYIRWGRNVCPGNAELVYKGYIGGSYYNDPGSGSDSICLPSDPTWLNYHDGGDPDRAYIFGTETDIAYNVFDKNVAQMDMPCALCSIQKASSIMIPARKDCYPGWSLEYNGYLMATQTGHEASSQHLCMDVHPEFLPHGGSNDNQHILYVVEGRCGSLPCPPYVEGRELTCSVCSK